MRSPLSPSALKVQRALDGFGHALRAATGFVIGGVPPVGHERPIETFVAEDLLSYDEIWAAAGTPNAVFWLTTGEVEAVFTGKFVRINS